MTKVGILAHKADFDEVTARLGEMGVVQISRPREIFADSGKDIEDLLVRIKRAVDFFASFSEKPPEPLKMTSSQLREMVKAIDLHAILTKTESERRELENAKSRLSEIENSLRDILPYRAFSYSFDEIRGAGDVVIRLGYLPKVSKIEPSLEEYDFAELFASSIISKDTDGNYLVIYYHKSATEQTEKYLSDNDFGEFRFENLHDTPAMEIARLQTEHTEVKSSIEALSARFKDDAKGLLPKLKASEGFYRAEMAEQRLRDIAESTDQTLYLTGWTKKADIDKLKSELSNELAAMVEVVNSDEHEAPPVALKNPPVIEAFEVITDLYGRPRPGMIDPTPFIAPFFPLFFALCLTDAGYGLLLALLGGGFLAFGKLGSGARKFMRFILYSGIATVVVGALAGGWFGIDLEAVGGPVANALLSIKLFDPLGDAIEFFAASVFLGVIQVSVGFVISGYVGAKEAENVALKVRAVLLAMSWISVTLGAGIFIANFLVPEFMTPFTPIGTAGLKYGALGIVGFSLILGIAGKRGIGASLGDGLAFDGLYGIVNLFGDLLSYARILALGLSTGVIAGVINIIAGQLVEMIPGVGIVIAGLLVLVGHVAYTGLSALGAFVHPARLHFVEYFTKFYEAGGEPFAPYSREVDGVEIVE